MTGIENNCVQIANLLADGLVCLCRDISITLKLFHNKLNVPRSCFQEIFDFMFTFATELHNKCHTRGARTEAL